ncbi:methionine biosynthesis protein MetW [Pseudoduganella flava]|uniref:Methionine biosynthesis protein MetW n=1 Tax=Pseudoduganella flava TaxID=871742 RepID=A0A562Q2Y3_9BURK|nr:methionine biosynthesis protein MetW [Pseudoduganella flava]QGZ41109.1 methionine biosynthesis protein MetW [Pseudoduganella flava]TWI51032.1 methionine biosynthesis protein MetW [Pseudoduganella flava]
MTFDDLKTARPDLAFIAHWIKPGAHVLDVGCGDGVMMDYLQTDKGCTGYGLELADEQVLASTERGVRVIQQDFEKGRLALFGDDTFDTVLCLSALQMMQHVEALLRDIVRVGIEAIVSFPNFAYWPHRVALLRGRMPVSKTLPYQWYDTPNVRCATIEDFRALAAEVGVEVIEYVALAEGKIVEFLPNLRGELAVFRLRKRSGARSGAVAR